MALTMNNPLKIAKDSTSGSVDWEVTERHFADLLLEAKALQFKSAEHMKR